jgi:hypothetical protein
MAKNSRLILKTESQEIFTDQNYKIHPELLENPLWSSLNTQPSFTDLSVIHRTPDMKTLNQRVIGIYYGGENKTVSVHNNQALYDTINLLRNSSSGHTNILETEDNLLEYIPDHPHILEQIENLERMENEYPSKLNMLNYLVGNLFDINYATNMFMIGREISVTPDANGRIHSPYDGIGTIRISGYIKVENALQNINMNIIIRGIPVPMRRTLTSITRNSLGNITGYNYIFTYPQYLMDNIDTVQAIQYIEVNNRTGAQIFFGKEYDFKLTNTFGFENKLNNIHIVNKSGRNLKAGIVETHN